MKISLIAFDDFTDIDLWLMWDLLNRVKDQNWEIRILGEKAQHTSHTGIVVNMHGTLEEANTSDAVLFVSGPGTRVLINSPSFLNSFKLNPEKQLIGSMCSGALILAALGILKAGQEATTYPTAKIKLESFGINVVEKSFVNLGNVSTAAGCLAAQELSGWIIEKLAGEEMKNIVLESIMPVGKGLSFSAPKRNVY